MKILLDQNDVPVFEQVAQHMGIELPSPKLLYEIESEKLTVVAIALGGVQFVETTSPPAQATLAIVEMTADEIARLGNDQFVQGWDEVDKFGVDSGSQGGDVTVRTVIKGNGHAKPLTITEKTKACVICGSPVIGRGPRATTCSPSCQTERARRYQVDVRMKKLQALGNEPVIGRDLDEPEEAGTVIERPLA